MLLFIVGRCLVRIENEHTFYRFPRPFSVTNATRLEKP